MTFKINMLASEHKDLLQDIKIPLKI